MRLRKPTDIIRATFINELRLVLDAELEVPANAVRRVQVVATPGAQLYLTLDAPTPDDIALSREHLIPPIFPGMLPFKLMSGQRMYGMVASTEQPAKVSLIVEYLEP